MFNITKRNVVKTAARVIVRHTCGQAAAAGANAITNPESDESNETIETVAYVAGYATSSVLLDRKINETIDRVADWRTARKEKKNSEKTPTE